MTSARPRLALLALALCAAALPLGAPALARAEAAADTVDLIVRREPGLDAAARAQVRAEAGVRFQRRMRLADTEVVTVPADRAEAALADLRSEPTVRWAQRDGVVRAQAVTTDPLFDELWGLRNTGQTVWGDPGTADADMDVPEAWPASTGSDVTVAVVDTGVDADHPDLMGRLDTNAGETGPGQSANGVDDDGDGLVDNWRGYDFAYDDNDPSDPSGHGTHVAGTIAAANGNGVGVTGVAPDAKVLALKALGDDGLGAFSDVADAFDYAGDLGVPVVNASLAGIGGAPGLEDVIHDHPDTLYVVAAGNDNADLDATIYTPCEVPEPNVLCVGASDNDDEKASFSNYSPASVDVFAPGVTVLSTTGGDYHPFDGTSMAAPHVAGEAALLFARYPGLSPVEVKDAIMRSAERKPALAPYGHDGGRANARAALDLLAAVGDGDGDDHPDASDNCPGTANADQRDTDQDGDGDACDPTPNGPDTDGDGTADLVDTCVLVPNQDQRDTDGDHSGDACDAAPRGPDSDGDGLADMDDGCPFAGGHASGGGCPAAAPSAAVSPPVARAPVPAPPAPTRIASITAVTAGKPTCRGGRCTRTVTVAVALTPGARIARVVARQKVCARGRCAWRTVARSTTARVRLPAGRFRLTVVASGPAGRASRTVGVTVRGR